MKKLTKSVVCTDIHFGTKSNSEQHNQDCLNFIDWFCDRAKEEGADNIMFLGDWFENRSAVNVSTLNYSYRGAKKLNDLGIPIFFIIGNHDLYYRHNREMYSTIQFHEFSNFTIINEPTIIDEIETSPLLCPYLFPHEYPDLIKYNNTKTWWGHFEFKGFVITGYNITMLSGPDHTEFSGPKYIFSGHFHKRQRGGNVVYIGNTFPTNFSDTNDNERGCMVYDHITQNISFFDWEQCPKYVKITLSDVLNGNINIPKNARVQCLMDTPLTFEESMGIKQQFIDDYELREFISCEPKDLADAITDSDMDIDSDDDQNFTLDDLVIQMLESVNVSTIDNDVLVAQYQRL